MLGCTQKQVNETDSHSSPELKQAEPLSIDTIWCILASIPKTRMNIFLTGEQKWKLESLSLKTGAPVAELVRRAIDAYLVSRKKELK